MKLVSFRANGSIHHGVVRGAEGSEEVVDLGQGDLLGAIEGGKGALAGAGQAGGRGRPLRDVQLVAPIVRPPNLFCLAANYQDHIREGGGEPVKKEVIAPKVFMKPSSTIIGPNDPLVLPSVSETTDWELELAVVIGQRCRNVSRERALDVVFGYAVINDISARTVDYGYQRNEYGWKEVFDWLQGKWPDGFAPFGPYITTADEIPDPQNIKMKLSLNGQVKQDANTRDMIFGVADTIAFLTRFCTLQPGDVIATGTPGGVGDATGTYLKAGDVMECWVEKCGTQRTRVEAARK